MKKTTASLIAAIAVIAVIATYAFISIVMPQAGKYDKLAKCLTANGAIMYGSQTCHVCIYQRQLLGDSAKYITEVDCVQQYDLCMNQRIGAMPTWLINGSFIIGFQKPEQLANLSGCAI